MLTDNFNLEGFDQLRINSWVLILGPTGSLWSYQFLPGSQAHENHLLGVNSSILTTFIFIVIVY